MRRGRRSRAGEQSLEPKAGSQAQPVASVRQRAGAAQTPRAASALPQHGNKCSVGIQAVRPGLCNGSELAPHTRAAGSGGSALSQAQKLSLYSSSNQNRLNRDQDLFPKAAKPFVTLPRMRSEILLETLQQILLQ